MKKKPKLPRARQGKRRRPSQKHGDNKRSVPVVAAITASEAAELQEAACKALSDAEQLYQKSHGSDLQADELHQSILELHEKVRSADALSRGTGVGGEEGELVVDEQTDGDGKPFPIVGVGASAGGFEAFTDFLKALPGDTGMAFVLVQHLDPNHKSQLTELLARCSRMPLTEARGDLEVEANHIYVIPENTSISISNGSLQLTPRRTQDTPPMPVDHFFRSLARYQQERAIGVVLSGTGSDGTLGLEAIKGEGGITFAQDERSAKYFGMPASAIASGSVDLVLSPADIAKELGRIGKHPFVGRTKKPYLKEGGGIDFEKTLRESPSDLAILFSLLRARTGVDFSLYKQSTLKRRIIRRMILHKIDTLQSYVSLIQSKPPEVDALFHDLLINVTHFFRDPSTFQQLKKKVFPRILKGQADESPLRFWVCGCASGEEAYSLAICLVEFFERHYIHRQAQIFATDVSDTSIEKARAGVYPENIQQDVSPERLRRFFTKVNGNYQVNKSIRDMCIFARQNLVIDPPFSNLDLVTCRNVLIYFGPALQGRIIPLFHYSLRPTGLLLLGNSESIGSATDYFGLLDKKHKVFFKKPNSARPGFDLTHTPRHAEAKGTQAVAEQKESRGSELADMHHQVDRILLREFSPGAVVINSEFEVVQFRGRTAEYLEHAPGNASLNLLKMAKESLSLGLRSALNKAAKQDGPVRLSGVELRRNGLMREITLEVVPFRLGVAQEQFYLVVFQEPEPPTDESIARASRASSKNKGGAGRRELSKLRQELMATKDSLQSIIEQQEATNEELRSANEEIQSSNEELQSTNEELETAKEELQSTNEELSTLNEELQNRNSELSLLNNDLTNLLASVNVAIIMLGNDLTIRRFTPLAERIFNLIPADVGRRLSDLSRAILVPDLDASVREVIDNLNLVEREAQDRDGHWYLLRIRPYRTRENKIDGAVILLVDIDELLRVMDVLMSATHEPLLVLGVDCKIRKANEAFCTLFKISTEELSGRSLYQAAGGQWNLPALKKLVEQTSRESKQVDSTEVQSVFPKAGLRKFHVTSRRVFQESRGVQLLLLSFEEVSGSRAIDAGSI